MSKIEVSQDNVWRVLQYIRLNVGPDMKLQRATADIGQALGKSHVTVHRALAVLELEGYITVDRSTHPLTITLLKDRIKDERTSNDPFAPFLESLGDLVRALQRRARELVQENQRLKDAAETWMKLAPYLVDEEFIPAAEGSGESELILRFRGLHERPVLR